MKVDSLLFNSWYEILYYLMLNIFVLNISYTLYTWKRCVGVYQVSNYKDVFKAFREVHGSKIVWKSNHLPHFFYFIMWQRIFQRIVKYCSDGISLELLSCYKQKYILQQDRYWKWEEDEWRFINRWNVTLRSVSTTVS